MLFLLLPIQRLAFLTPLCYTVFMNYSFYKKLYEPQAAFFKKHSWARTALKIGNYFCTGLPAIAYFSLLASQVVNKAWYALISSVCIPLACFLFVTLFRAFIHRKRPYDSQGAAIEPVFLKENKADSFPSRHVASATVIAMAYAYYCFPLGIGLFLVTTLLAYARFVSGFHYPTDLLCGGAIGALFGGLFFLI